MVADRLKRDEFSLKKMKNLIFSCIESRIEEGQSIYGCFKLGPFNENQSLTIANTLRRILLSNIEGIAIVFVEFAGIKHEYSVIQGVQESVLEILTNLKSIKFRTNQKIYKPQIAYLKFKGPKVIYSGDLRLPPSLQCINPHQYIATLANDGNIQIKLFICQGRRFFLQNSLKPLIQKQFKKLLTFNFKEYLFLDTIFFPIQKVNFTLETNQKLNKEFILIEIWTNGSLYPKTSLYKSIIEIIRILLPFRNILKKKYIIYSKNLYIFQQINRKNLTKIKSSKFQEKLFSLDISNLNFKLPTYYFLKEKNIDTISDLLNQSKKDWSFLRKYNKVFFNDIKKNLSMIGLEIN